MENHQNLPDIVQTVKIESPIEKVWEKVSTAEGIESWFMPNDLKAEVGHQFHLQSPFGPSPCKVTAVEPPHSLSFQWDTNGWEVTFHLKEDNGGTEFTLTHGGWKQEDVMVPKAQEDASVIRERMNGGWKDILQKLITEVEG